MERVTLRIEEENLEKVEKLVEEGEYPNQTEVFRDGLEEVFAEYDFDEMFRPS